MSTPFEWFRERFSEKQNDPELLDDNDDVEKGNRDGCPPQSTGDGFPQQPSIQVTDNDSVHHPTTVGEITSTGIVYEDNTLIVNISRYRQRE